MPLLLDQFGRPAATTSAHRSALRQDGWQNFTTGIGTSRDKTTLGSFWQPWRVLDNELLALYNGSDLAAKIVEKRPFEMFRRGYDLTADGADASELQDLQSDACERFRLDEQLVEAFVWGRLFGGNLLIVGADDGQTMDQPLDITRIKTVNYIFNVDRRFAWAQSYYSSPQNTKNRVPKHGMPELYLITNVVSQSMPQPGDFNTSVVHESRVIRFDGTPTDVLTRQQLAGWSWSVLQRVYDAMRRFEHAFDSVGHLLSDASQAVFKIQGLIDMIGANQISAVRQRMAVVDETRSTARAVLLDTEGEEFERIETSFGGLPEILDRMMMRLAAAADMPLTELFGRSAAGLNATGEGDTRKWYDTIASEQQRFLEPKLRYLYRILAAAEDSPVSKKDLKIDVDFHALWAPTDLEEAQAIYQLAQADQIYLTAKVVTPEEVALDRQELYPSMNVEDREMALERQKKFDPYEGDPLASAQAAAALANGATQGEPQSPVVPMPLPAAPEERGAPKGQPESAKKTS